MQSVKRRSLGWALSNMTGVLTKTANFVLVSAARVLKWGRYGLAQPLHKDDRQNHEALHKKINKKKIK